MVPFRYGIEHELAILHADGTFADHTDLRFDALQAVVDALPQDAGDYPDLCIGDQGSRRKRWYVEGFERFDDDGVLLRCDPKGLEIRTRIHRSIPDAVAAVVADAVRLAVELARRGLAAVAIGFNPVRSEYVIDPPLNAWERAHRTGSPGERTAYPHMSTFGPDLNLSCVDLGPATLTDVARELTHYSPRLVPLSFSSPFRDGAPWGGLSARTHVRTGARPAVLVFLGPGDPQVDTDPSLTQLARLPAEVGRIEFEACPDVGLYGELLSLWTGLVLDDSLPGRRSTPDAAVHRHVARVGLTDDEVHAGTGALLDAATAALVDRPADTERLGSLRDRWTRRECPATAMLATYGSGGTVAGLSRSHAS